MAQTYLEWDTEDESEGYAVLTINNDNYGVSLIIGTVEPSPFGDGYLAKYKDGGDKKKAELKTLEEAKRWVWAVASNRKRSLLEA